MLFFRTSERPWRRRNYFIKKGFQGRFILKFLGVVTFGSAMSGYVMYLLVDKDVEDAFYSSHIKLSTTGQLLLPTLLKVNFGVLVLVLLAVAAITLSISHKVAGPLHRLGRDAERIGRGDLTGSFRLRTNDELKSLAKTFEDMNKDMKERFNGLRSQAEEVERAADDLVIKYACSSFNRTGPEEEVVEAQIDRLLKTVDIFGKELSRFRLEKKSGKL